MVKHFCDICGRLLKSDTVRKDSDPLDYTYGSLVIEISTNNSIVYDEICNGCYQKLKDSNIEEIVSDYINNVCIDNN